MHQCHGKEQEICSCLFLFGRVGLSGGRQTHDRVMSWQPIAQLDREYFEKSIVFTCSNYRQDSLYVWSKVNSDCTRQQ
jgi:hypothetical protein